MERMEYYFYIINYEKYCHYDISKWVWITFSKKKEVGLDLFYFNLLTFICFYLTFLKFRFLLSMIIYIYIYILFSANQ